MASARVFCTFGLLVFGYLVMGEVTMVKGKKPRCSFPAIYGFGDSNLDTGGMSAALGPVPAPFGQTYFKKPSGRLTDGRLIIDFIAKYLRLPFVSAYLNSIGTNFSHGANFASAGSSIRPGPLSPFDLGIQVSQFLQFQSRTADLYNRPHNSGSLPKACDFPKAMYVIETGQNDLIFGFQKLTDDQVRVTIPDILGQFVLLVRQLYSAGARAFVINNVGPIGCAPMGAVMYHPKNDTYDENHCAVSQNDVVQEYNKQLKERVVQLRGQLPNASITYVDMYWAKFSVINNAVSKGFEQPWKFCCGMATPVPVLCGSQVPVNGTVLVGKACDNPSKFIY